MQRKSLIVLMLMLALTSTTYAKYVPSGKVFFSPPTAGLPNECEQEVLRGITHAETSIQILSYQLTSQTIKTALIQAVTQHVRVQVLMDYHLSKYAKRVRADLINGGVEVEVYKAPRLMHDKVILIDNAYTGSETGSFIEGTPGTVLTGSYNFTKDANYNDENLIPLTDPEIVTAYQSQFIKLWNLAKIQTQPTLETEDTVEGKE